MPGADFALFTHHRAQREELGVLLTPAEFRERCAPPRATLLGPRIIAARDCSVADEFRRLEQPCLQTEIARGLAGEFEVPGQNEGAAHTTGAFRAEI